MFKNNLDIIYFIYGSSFVIMGVVILRQPKEGSAFKLAGILWLLAGFGLFHGINEWLDMWVILKGKGTAIVPLQWICLVTSYAFLFEFGRRTLRITGQSSPPSQNRLAKGLVKYVGWWVPLFIGSIGFFYSMASRDLLKAGDITARYALGFTGSILTAYGFIAYYHCEKEILTKTKTNIRIPFLFSGLAFLLYAVLGGLVVPKGDFFPSSWVNECLFSRVAGIPVQFFRAGVAVVVTISVTEILNVFNWEAKNRLQYEILKLQALEDRHRALIETIPDIVYTVDVNGNFTFINNAVKKLGYEPEELIGLHFTKIIAPEEIEYVSSKSVLPKQLPKPIERIFESTSKLFNDRETDRRSATGLEVHMVKKKIEHDFPEECFPEEGFPEAGFPEESSQERGYREEAGTSTIVGEINVSEIYDVNSDTMKNELIGSLGIIKATEFAGSTGVIRDITERKRQIDNLKKSEQQMEDIAIKSAEEYRRLSQQFIALLEAIPDKIVLLSPDRKIIWANTSAIKSMKKPDPETTQQRCHEPSFNEPSFQKPSCYELCYDSLTPCLDCHTLICFTTGEVQYNQRTDPDGTIWDIRAFPIKDTDGKTINVIELSCDITEKVTLQKNAITARHLASLGELSAGVAHEINNPINSIINCAQIIADNTTKGSKAHEYSSGIMIEGDRIANIVRSLLSFARENKSDKIITDIYTPLTEIVSMVEAQMRKDGITFIVDLPPGLPNITANTQQIQQVFLNVISNGRYALNEKYPGKHKDKVLKITCGEIKKNGVSVNTASANGAPVDGVTADGIPYIRLKFTDNGTGISSRVLERVKEPFFTTKPLGKGTGLGLSISHGIINDHNGRLEIESFEGSHTCIIIDLPAVTEEKIHS